jgi:hypothetical protein
LDGDVELTPAGRGTRLRLRVKPGARRTAIVGAHGGALKVSVAAAPEKGKANREVVELLASVLGLNASAVVIVSGETSRDKVAEVGLTPAEVRAILGAL